MTSLSIKSAVISFGVVAGFSAFMSSPARADCTNHPGQQRPRVCAEFYYSDAVFEGTVVSTRQVPEEPSTPANIMGWFYTLEITKAYRGLAQRTVEIYAGNDPTGIPLLHGHNYILFTKKDSNGMLAANSCGSTGEISKSTETMTFLNKLMEDRKISTRGEIGGRIVAVEPGTISLSNDPAPSIRVSARAGDKTFTDITDGQGWFHISVPAGKYKVAAESTTWTVTPYTLSYTKPDNVTVENAGCADLEFLAEPKKGK